MTIPDAFPMGLKDIHYYQGVLLVEVALTLVIYFILKVFHYIKWGHDEEQVDAPAEDKPAAEKKEGEE